MIEIDQSVKIEQTAQNTILAMANSMRYTILIPANVKRKLIAVQRKQGKSRNTARYRLFAAGLFVLLRPHLPEIIKHDEQIMIDPEYIGQDSKIKSMLLRHAHNAEFDLQARSVFFAPVGKSSNAHRAGWRVQRGLDSANHVVRFDELASLL